VPRAKVGQARAESAAHEVRGAVDRPGTAELLGARTVEVKGHRRLVVRVAVRGGRVNRERARELVETPPRCRAGGEDHLGRRAGGQFPTPSWFSAHLLEQLDRGLSDARLRTHLESSRARRPSVVAAKQVVLHGRNVAVAAVREFDHHRPLQRAGSLQFQAGDGVGLARRRRDRDIAEAQRLHDDLGFLALVQEELLARVDFGLGHREAVAHRGDHPLRPLEPLRVGRPVT
jgi:hypothetical protein